MYKYWCEPSIIKCRKDEINSNSGRIRVYYLWKSKENTIGWSFFCPQILLFSALTNWMIFIHTSLLSTIKQNPTALLFFPLTLCHVNNPKNKPTHPFPIPSSSSTKPLDNGLGICSRANIHLAQPTSLIWDPKKYRQWTPPNENENDNDNW
jgi:hypothetical protein